MSPFGDDEGTMSNEKLDNRDVEALLAGREVPGEEGLLSMLGLVRSASTLPAPPPSLALAAVLRDGLTPQRPAAPAGRARPGRRATGVAAAVVAALAMTVGAAVADILPAPMQAGVADVVSRLSPLELPYPADSSLPADEAPVSPDAPGPDSGGNPAELPAPLPGDRKGAGDAHDAVGDDARDGREPHRDAEDGADGDQPDGGEEPDEGEADEPTTDEPTTDEPTTDQSQADEPTTDESQADEPQADAAEPGQESPDGVLDDAERERADATED